MDLEKIVNTPGLNTSVIELNEDKFSTFIKIAKMIGMASCSDFIVKDSRLRQLNDRRSLIFDIPLNTLLGDSKDIAISTIVNKIDLLDPWMKQQVNMKLVTENTVSPSGQQLTKYIFKDEYGGIEFIKPLDGYLNNETISETQLKTMLDLSEEVIASFSINKMYLERLYALQKGLSASLLTIDFKNGEAIFKISSNDSSNATVGKLYTCPTNVVMSGYSQFSVQAFLSNRDEISGEILKRNNGDIVLKLESTIDEIPIRIWTISVLEQD